MNQFSLKLRSILLTISALGIFIPTTVFTLEQAYANSLKQAKFDQLKAMNLALISAFEFDGSDAYMPDFLYVDQLNLPQSGYLAFVTYNNDVVWQSASSFDFNFAQPELVPSLGEEVFREQQAAVSAGDNEYFLFAFTAEFDHPSGFVPVHFYVLNHIDGFNQEKAVFLSTAWKWLLTLSVGLIIVLWIGSQLILSPVRNLIEEIKRITSGQQTDIQDNYPPEFNPLQTSINKLIRNEEEQRQRYKNSLGDLAHSLKTPLAVALGSPRLPGEAQDALQQMNQLIQRQLKRASAGSASLGAKVAIGPTTHKITGALAKVYRDKSLRFSVDTANLEFFGDETDLMELLGNTIDNGAKAAHSQVRIHAEARGQWLVICVDDDGPGIPAAQIPVLLQRGQRLDTYTEGQGIGLAVVSDLVAIYQGKLDIHTSALGGASICMEFPMQQQS